MDTHEDHTPVRFTRPSVKERIGFFATTVLAMGIVFLGWYVIVFRDIRDNVGDTKSQISSGLSAAAQIREQTESSRANLDNSAIEMKEMFEPFSEAMREQEAVMDVVAKELMEKHAEESAPASAPAEELPTE